jgi:tetratricopeptide (TPR) repeat protein
MFAEAFDEAGLVYMAKYTSKRETKDLLAAIDQYSKAISADPHLFAAHLHQAEAYQVKGDHTQCLDRLEKAFDMNPANQDIHEAILRVLPLLKSPDEALNRLQSVVDHSLDFRVLNQWGRTLLAFGKIASAVEHLLKGLRAAVESAAIGAEKERDMVIFSNLIDAIQRTEQPQDALKQVGDVLSHTKIPIVQIW